jgi:hypothetical protein
VLTRELLGRARVLQRDVVERVVDDVLADALLALAVQVDHGAETGEARSLELEPLELVGIDLQGQAGDLLVAAHRAMNLAGRVRWASRRGLSKGKR